MSVLEWWSILNAYGPFLLFVAAGLGLALYVFAGSLRQVGGGSLQGVYPPVEPAPGTRRTMERIVFGKGPRMTWVKVGVDHAHLHVAIVGSLRTRGRFSVPLGEVTAEPDRFPLLIPTPGVRLTFARDPGRPMLVRPPVFARLSAASQGRLALAGAAGAGASDARPPERSYGSLGR